MQQSEEDMDTEVEAEVEVDITEEASSRGIFVQKPLKQLYKNAIWQLAYLEKSLESLIFMFFMRHQK